MMQGRPSRPMAVIEQLQQLDKIEPLSASLDAIPADVDVLMLVHPQNLPPKTLFAIDQFVLKGGKALIFVDPHSELQAAQASQMNPPGSPTASNLAPLFKSWGFQMLPGVVAGDRRDAQRGQRAGPRAWRRAARLHRLARPAFAANLNRNDMITADLSHMTMASAGIIEPLPGAKTTIEPLITTSPDSTKIPVDKLERAARRRRPARRFQVRRQALHPRRPSYRHGPDRVSRRAADSRPSRPSSTTAKPGDGQAGRRKAGRRRHMAQTVGASDQCRRRRRHRSARRPPLGAEPGFLRPAGRRADRQQWRLCRQRDRRAGRRRGSGRAAQPRHRGPAL